MTKIVSGTVDKFYELSYIISSLAPKPPKPAIKIILLQAIYALRYTNIPRYAVVNENVSLAEEKGMGALKGFVNAVLKRAAAGDYKLPSEGEKDYEEVKYNAPPRLIKLIKAEYPDDFEKILLPPDSGKEHVRLSNKLSPAEFLKNEPEAEPTERGFLVKNNEYVKSAFEDGLLTYQSLTSILAVTSLGDIKGKKFLDLCAAPGGKSVLAAERGAEVLAADIYPHRTELVKAYAKRMGVKLKNRRFRRRGFPKGI